MTFDVVASSCSANWTLAMELGRQDIDFSERFHLSRFNAIGVAAGTRMGRRFHPSSVPEVSLLQKMRRLSEEVVFRQADKQFYFNNDDVSAIFK
jgi:hypothetical protein